MGVAKMITPYQILKNSNLVTEKDISSVRIIRAYNIDDLFHTGRIDPPCMEKIVYIVRTCKLKHIISIKTIA